MIGGEVQARVTDPADGWFDVSSFLDSAYGFVPLLSPITEPAVGYGAAGALLFIDRPPPSDTPGVAARPNIFAVGGLLTENGTQGVFAGHLGTWRQGKLRSTVGIGDFDAHLQFSGLGVDTTLATGFDYRVRARGGVAELGYRPGASHLWVGLRYLFADTRVRFGDVDPADIPGALGDGALTLAALTPTLTWDNRNNFFTPSRGLYLSLELPLYRDWLGGDRDFEKVSLTGMYFHSFGERLFLGLRAGAKQSSNGTPFFLLPYVSLRGLEALSVVGEQAIETEAELRWQFHPRFSAVGFIGGGEARTSVHGRTSSESVLTGGAGFRYLLARTYGLHMGADVGFGPGDPVLYIVFGSAWIRP